MEMKSPANRRLERAKAPPEDWRNLMLASTQEDEIVGLVRDHMALWSPEEIGRLPIECRPPRIRDAEDISRWAFELASTHCAQVVGPEDEPFLDRMLEFVTQAAMRLSLLKAEAPTDYTA
jgi:hypothetical protein